MRPRSPLAFGSLPTIALAARRSMLKVPIRLMLTTLAKLSRRCGPSRPTTFSAGGDAGAIHQSVDPAKTVQRSAYGGFAVLFAGDVAADEERVVAELLLHRGAGFFVHVGHHDLAAPATTMRAVAAPRPEAAPVTMNTLS